MMRTDRAGDLRTTDIEREVVVCGWVDGRRDHGGVVFLDVRDVAGIVQVVVDPDAAGRHRRAPGAQRVRRAGRGHRAPPARGHGQRHAADRRDRGRGDRARGAERVRHAAVPGRRSHRRRRDAATPAPLRRPAPAASATQPARSRAGERRAAPLARRAGLHRGRDPDADRVDARRRARLRGAVAPVAGGVLRAAAEPAVVQAAAHGRRRSTATTRSPAVCATRTCAPTASSSSCSSTRR